MTGLHDYYSTHGLEHLLNLNQPIKTEQNLHCYNVTSNYTNPLLHEYLKTRSLLPSKHPALFSDDVVAPLKQATADMVQNITSQEQVNAKSLNDASILHQSRTHGSFKDHKSNENLPLPVTLLSSTPSIRNLYSVDVDSLRKMNFEFLKSMGLNTKPNLQTLTSINTAKQVPSRLASSIPNTRRREDMSVLPVLPNSLLSLCQRGGNNLNSTILEAMNHALEITSNCADPIGPLDPSNHFPATLEILPVDSNCNQ
jgi:hypothetical protein